MEFATIVPMLIGVCLAILQAAAIFLVSAFFGTAAEAAARTVLTNQTGGR
jgi:Flp pilus assembly protein TadG